MVETYSTTVTPRFSANGEAHLTYEMVGPVLHKHLGWFKGVVACDKVFGRVYVVGSPHNGIGIEVLQATCISDGIAPFVRLVIRSNVGLREGLLGHNDVATVFAATGDLVVMSMGGWRMDSFEEVGE